MIIFENPGEIDIDAMTLIGVNVKSGPSPIGFFGTGMKYVIARMGAWGEPLVVQSGLAEYQFRSEARVIRGKEFQVLIMQGSRDARELGFTTELGKTWEPWMVYRELWCNAQDEGQGAQVYQAEQAPRPQAGMTRVIVSGKKLEAAHAVRGEFLLLDRGEPLARNSALVEIYPGQSEVVFYRGVRVMKLGRPGLYTYNILRPLELTEDRTAQSWDVNMAIANGLAELGPAQAEIIEKSLLAGQGSFESRLDYDYVYKPGETWLSIGAGFAASKAQDLVDSARRKFVPVKADCCPMCGKPRG